MDINVEGVNWDVEACQKEHKSEKHFIAAYKDSFYTDQPEETRVSILKHAWSLISPAPATKGKE